MSAMSWLFVATIYALGMGGLAFLLASAAGDSWRKRAYLWALGLGATAVAVAAVAVASISLAVYLSS